MKFLLCFGVVLCLHQIKSETDDEAVTKLVAELFSVSKERTVNPEKPIISARFQYALNEWERLKNETLNRVHDFERVVNPALYDVLEFYKSNQDVVYSAQNAFNSTYNGMVSYVKYVTKEMEDIVPQAIPYVMTALNRVNSNQQFVENFLKTDLSDCLERYKIDEVLEKWDSGSNDCMTEGIATTFKTYLKSGFKFIEIQYMFTQMFDVDFYKDLSQDQVIQNFGKMGTKSQSDLAALYTTFDTSFKNMMDTVYRCHAKVVNDVEEYVYQMREMRNKCFEEAKHI